MVKFCLSVLSGAQACVLAFSTVDRDSFEAIESWKRKVLDVKKYTMKILNIGTGTSEQTVQTLIRLLLEEQSDQGLHPL